MKKLLLLSLVIVGCASWKETTRTTVDYINVVARNTEPTIQQLLDNKAKQVIVQCAPVWEKNCKEICFPQTVQLEDTREACEACIIMHCPDLNNIRKLRVQVAEAFQKIFIIIKHINLAMPYLDKEKVIELRNQLKTEWTALLVLLKKHELIDDAMTYFVPKD